MYRKQKQQKKFKVRNAAIFSFDFCSTYTERFRTTRRHARRRGKSFFFCVQNTYIYTYIDICIGIVKIMSIEHKNHPQHPECKGRKKKTIITIDALIMILKYIQMGKGKCFVCV